jgi:hypothetical protein
MASLGQIRAALTPADQRAMDGELSTAPIEELPAVVERWRLRAQDRGYELLAAAQDDEDRAFHTAMRARQRSRPDDDEPLRGFLLDNDGDSPAC